MRCITLCLTSALLITVLAACRPDGPPPPGPQAEPSPPSATRLSASPTAPEAPTIAGAGQDDAEGPAAQPTQGFREALTAREAFAVADEAAQARHAEYQLYEVLGCHKAASYGQFERDSHLVEGTCAQWLLYYVRPVDPNSPKGYHALFIRVGPNGVLETTEEPREAQVRKKAQGDPAGWQVDSTQAIEIAEGEGGRAYREANPQWDTSRFDADRNAVLMATLQLTPYWDSTTGKEYAGSEGAVWVITYPPLHALQFVIDATTGKVLLERTR